MDAETRELVTQCQRGQKTEDYVVIAMSLEWVRVCSKRDEDKALAAVRKHLPSGREHGWRKATIKKQRPVACKDGGGQTHYMFIC